MLKASGQVAVVGIDTPTNRERNNIETPSNNMPVQIQNNARAVNIFLKKGGYLGLFMSGLLGRKQSVWDARRNSHCFKDNSQF